MPPTFLSNQIPLRSGIRPRWLARPVTFGLLALGVILVVGSTIEVATGQLVDGVEFLAIGAFFVAIVVGPPPCRPANWITAAGNLAFATWFVVSAASLIGRIAHHV